MTTNATVEARHTEQAQHVAGFYWDDRAEWFAQTLANLEAARAENADLTNRLAEIDRQLGMYSCSACDVARKLASGHTPSPCPSCAAKDAEIAIWQGKAETFGRACSEKDEAMEAFQREVSDAVVEFGKSSRFDVARTAESYHSHLSRFIIPPADPVAEALKALWKVASGCVTEAQFLDRAPAELKSRLPLGGAK